MKSSLNALTGIDGFWTDFDGTHKCTLTRCLNALTGIDGFWTNNVYSIKSRDEIGLNALTGIDGFWTGRGGRRDHGRSF